MMLASLSDQLVASLLAHGALVIFAVMAIDAVLPVGGELTMLAAGALAGGTLAGHAPSIFGHPLPTGPTAYIVLATIGALGYLVGAIAGWWIGRRGGRTAVARYGHLLHLGPVRFARAERWFQRHGSATVLVGRLIPLMRSLVSIPAGVLGQPLRRYIALTAIGSAIWCYGLAAIGWALGAQYSSLHHATTAIEVALAALVALSLAAAWALARRQRDMPDEQVTMPSAHPPWRR